MGRLQFGKFSFTRGSETSGRLKLVLDESQRSTCMFLPPDFSVVLRFYTCSNFFQSKMKCRSGKHFSASRLTMRRNVSTHEKPHATPRLCARRRIRSQKFRRNRSSHHQSRRSVMHLLYKIAPQSYCPRYNSYRVGPSKRKAFMKLGLLSFNHLLLWESCES